VDIFTVGPEAFPGPEKCAFFPAVLWYFCVLVQEYLGLDRDLETDHDLTSVTDQDPNSIGSVDPDPGRQK
jgi:hypothetical protein